MHIIEKLFKKISDAGHISYAQSGEDILIAQIFKNITEGFYVDVGAHHPTRFSNTYILYKRGWHGINIDATPQAIELLKKKRSRDINIHAAVSETSKDFVLHTFKKPALNTLSTELAASYEKDGFPIQECITLRTLTLNELLKQHMPTGQKIHLLSVDAENFDLEVLRSNDWTAFRPEVVAIEDLEFDPEHPTTSPIYSFLHEKGYKLRAYIGNSLLFKSIN